MFQEVGVNVAIQFEIPGWLEYCPLVHGSSQVANDSLDSRGVTFLWGMAESGDLAYGVGNIRARVGGKIKEHSHD